MASPFRSGFLAGLVAGFALAGAAALIFRSSSSSVVAGPAPLPDRTAQLQQANLVMARRLEELEKARRDTLPAPAREKAPEAAAPAPAPPGVGELFAKLSEMGLAGFRSPKYAETLEAVKKGGKASIDYLTNVLKTSASATERFYAAALLEGAADPGALPGLVAAMKGDGDDMVRRMASHAVAMLGTPDAQAPLREAATADPDWGVRVNSAYGLAKLKDDEGIRILQDAYESPKTPAEYRLPVLGGLADVAAPSTAPLFRKILTDTQDVTYLLASIGALEKMKDSGSLPALQQLADSSPSQLVKQAAARAVDAIRK
jgi:HEAT repeat protein